MFKSIEMQLSDELWHLQQLDGALNEDAKAGSFQQAIA